MIKERLNDVCRNQCGNCRSGFVVGVGEDCSLPISTAWCGAHCVSHAVRSRCTAPFLLFIFQLVPPCRNRCKSDCNPRVKILYTHGRVPRLQRVLSCSTEETHVRACVFPGKIKVVRTTKNCIKAWELLCYTLNNLAKDHFQKILGFWSFFCIFLWAFLLISSK